MPSACRRDRAAIRSPAGTGSRGPSGIALRADCELFNRNLDPDNAAPRQRERAAARPRDSLTRDAHRRGAARDRHTPAGPAFSNGIPNPTTRAALPHVSALHLPAPARCGRARDAGSLREVADVFPGRDAVQGLRTGAGIGRRVSRPEGISLFGKRARESFVSAAARRRPCAW